MMNLHEGLTYEHDPFAAKSTVFIDRITNTLSKKMVRKVCNLYGVEIWPWERGS